MATLFTSRWRTKQNLDYSFLMMYAKRRGIYYVQVRCSPVLLLEANQKLRPLITRLRSEKSNSDENSARWLWYCPWLPIIQVIHYGLQPLGSLMREVMPHLAAFLPSQLNLISYPPDHLWNWIIWGCFPWLSSGHLKQCSPWTHFEEDAAFLLTALDPIVQILIPVFLSLPLASSFPFN